MPKNADRTMPNAHLVEVAWEVCNQVGGIYTVIRSKASSIAQVNQLDYCLVGPFVNKAVLAEVEALPDDVDVYAKAAAQLRKRGYDVFYGTWLVTGKPRVVLLNPNAIEEKALNVVKYLVWKNHGVGTPGDVKLMNQVVAFGYLTRLFFDELIKLVSEQTIIAHFHEWMAGLPILDIKRDKLPIKTVFTTHATQLGRHLAINSPQFYAHLPFFKWQEEAKKFGVETEATIEFLCAKHCDVFTTVSEVTARECKHLLKRNPDSILPNGLNIERFEALHEFQNLHVQYKEEIHRFVMSHFFQSYAFDLSKTLYFFTSGRYEYKNKGFDLTLEALNRLNARLKAEQTDITVVMFFVTKRDFISVKPEVLQAKAMLQEILQTTKAIEQQVGKKLFYESSFQRDTQLPDLNDFVDEYWKLRYRRTLQAWKTKKNPQVVTHQLVQENTDEIVQYVKSKNLLNYQTDPVKIVYHPDFITTNSPLFGMDYGQFVRGCHLGIFPSYYEPWGYTPLECMASGIPSVTSDLSGFGDYVVSTTPEYEEHGLYVIERGKRTFDWSANQLTEVLYRFTKLSMRERIQQRNLVESKSAHFDWQNLIGKYLDAYKKVLSV